MPCHLSTCLSVLSPLSSSPHLSNSVTLLHAPLRSMPCNSTDLTTILHAVIPPSSTLAFGKNHVQSRDISSLFLSFSELGREAHNIYNRSTLPQFCSRFPSMDTSTAPNPDLSSSVIPLYSPLPPMPCKLLYLALIPHALSPCQCQSQFSSSFTLSYSLSCNPSFPSLVSCHPSLGLLDLTISALPPLPSKF
jgi:hypothetical protein